jgi:hypothetical protein
MTLCPVSELNVWSYDFIHERTKDKRSFRILTVIDGFIRESLGTVVRKNIYFVGCDYSFIKTIYYAKVA